MSGKLFFSQDILDVWCAEEKVKVENEILTINRIPPQKFKLIPAFRILKVAGDGKDTANIVNKVKTKEELDKLGADAYMNSVIVGETAYDGENGYLAEPLKEVKSEEKSEEELLTEFLLKNLS